MFDSPFSWRYSQRIVLLGVSLAVVLTLVLQFGVRGQNDGSSYIAIGDASPGDAPPGAPWDLLALKGAPGEQGERGPAGINWQSDEWSQDNRTLAGVRVLRKKLVVVRSWSLSQRISSWTRSLLIP